MRIWEYGSICVREIGYKQGKEEGRGILTSTRINIQASILALMHAFVVVLRRNEGKSRSKYCKFGNTTLFIILFTVQYFCHLHPCPSDPSLLSFFLTSPLHFLTFIYIPHGLYPPGDASTIFFIFHICSFIALFISSIKTILVF